MNDGFQLTNIFILIIKTSIKLLGFYLFTYFFYDTLIKSFLTRFFLFVRKLLCNCYHKF